MITLKTRNYTIAEMKTLAEALREASGFVCQSTQEFCDTCNLKKVCTDLSLAREYLRKQVEARESAYR